RRPAAGRPRGGRLPAAPSLTSVGTVAGQGARGRRYVDEQDARRHAWETPAGSPWTAGTPTPVGPDDDGPPPPPWVTRRRRRRRVVAIVAGVALLVAVPVGLLWAGVLAGSGDGA